MTKYKVYLDDYRTPIDPTWIVVRNYSEFVSTILERGIENIHLISFDHDLADVHYDPSRWMDVDSYEDDNEKTGLDCAKWLVEHVTKVNSDLPRTVVHSANPVGSVNIVNYINSFLRNDGKPATCFRGNIPHTVIKNNFFGN